MASSITIKFNNSIPKIDDFILLNLGGASGGFIERYKTVRTGPSQVTISNSALGNAVNFNAAFMADYNTFNEFTSEFLSGGRYKITHNFRDSFFDNATIKGNFAIIDSIVSSIPTLIPELLNENYTDIDCASVQSSFELNGDFERISIQYNDIVLINPGSNFTVTLPRGIRTLMRIQYIDNGAAREEYFTIKTPNSWGIAGFLQSITPNGFFIEIGIEETGFNPNTYEYSLDGQNYLPSSGFPGLLQGEYTGFVRDQYGCNQQRRFTVENDLSTIINSDIIEFPILNSFHFIEDQLVNGCEVYANEMNTFANDESLHNKKRFFHLVQKCDSIPTQFKSNYDTIDATLFGCNGVEIQIPIQKKSNNLNVFDTRDNIVRSHEGKLVFYINGGYIYDSQTGTIIGENTIVNDIFTYQNIGSVVNIESIGYVSIKDIVFAENLNSWVAKTDVDYSENASYLKITTNYNLEEFEVYEFEIDFQDLEGFYYIKVVATNETSTRTFYSEFIDVRHLHVKTHEIIHRNKTSKSIDYRTGIIHKMRLRYVVDKIYTPSDENSIHTKDTTVVQIKSEVYDSRTFTFSPMPTAIAIKLDQILTNDTLYIDRLQYVREVSPEIENIGGGNNLYNFKSTLRKALGNISGLDKMTVTTILLDQSGVEQIIGSGFLSLENESGFIELEDGSGFLRLE